MDRWIWEKGEKKIEEGDKKHMKKMLWEFSLYSIYIIKLNSVDHLQNLSTISSEGT